MDNFSIDVKGQQFDFKKTKYFVSLLENSEIYIYQEDVYIYY